LSFIFSIFIYTACIRAVQPSGGFTMLQVTNELCETKKIDMTGAETIWAGKRVIATAFFGRRDVPDGAFDGRLSAAARMTIFDENGNEIPDESPMPQTGKVSIAVAEQLPKLSPQELLKGTKQIQPTKW
jgi:hypothetical protein